MNVMAYAEGSMGASPGTPLLYKRDKPPRDERVAKYLQSIYEPNLRQLEKLLGRKFPELRRTWIDVRISASLCRSGTEQNVIPRGDHREK